MEFVSGDDSDGVEAGLEGDFNVKVAFFREVDRFIINSESGVGIGFADYFNLVAFDDQIIARRINVKTGRAGVAEIGKD